MFYESQHILNIEDWMYNCLSCGDIFDNYNTVGLPWNDMFFLFNVKAKLGINIKNDFEIIRRENITEKYRHWNLGLKIFKL